MPATVLIGLQWGDEGKGKITDLLAESADVVARFSGGANAGHTVFVDENNTVILHQLPSGLLRPGVKGIIGSGCVIDPTALFSEIKCVEDAGFNVAGRLFLSGKVHLVHPIYKLVERTDEKQRGEKAIGTTGRAIGPTYVEKFERRGIRLEDAAHPSSFRKKVNAQLEHHLKKLPDLTQDEMNQLREETDLFIEASTRLVDLARDVSLVLDDILQNGGSLIAEGSQGTLLDPDHGSYPFVTGGSCVAGGACSGLGIGPSKIDEVVGVLKAYNTRVGTGPFPTELTDKTGDLIREKGNEYGATTGRPRRCGWFDGVLARYTTRINGCSWIALTLLDVLNGFEKLRICSRYELDPDISQSIFETGVRMNSHVPVFEDLEGWDVDIRGFSRWDDLPENAKKYVERIEELAGAPIKAVSTGPLRNDIIWR
jgi:adenylosuccinate synthase